MCVWFAVLAVSGVGRVLTHPAILGALSPTHGASFLFNHGHEAFVALGGVVLAVTGAEALYADMGHFGAGSIRRAWFSLVFPALILNYLGPGRADPRAPGDDREPVLLAVPALGADPDGRALDDRHDHRVAGRDLGGVQRHPPGRPARLFAAAGDPPHLARGGRPGLRARRELDHLRGGRRARDRLRLLREPRLGLRDRGHRHARDRHAAVLLRRALALASVAGAGDRRRDDLPDRRPHVLRGEPDQGRARRLVPARDRAGRLQRAHHLAARPRDPHRAKDRGGRPAARLRRRGARASTHPSPARPAPRSS